MTPTFDDFLHHTPAAEAFRAAHPPTPTLTKAAVDTVLSAMREALPSMTIEKAASAVDELEALVATRIQAHPAETRQVAVATIFQSRPALYEAVRQETTVTSHGRTLREIYARAEAGTPPLTKSADAEIMRRVESLMSKTSGASFEQALAFLGREDPALLARWGRNSYAEQM